MRSTPPPNDLSTPARIRKEAITLFAERGFAKTSVRAIAEAAQVSPGLVIHHFGSKEELRKSCDDYITEEIITLAKNKGNANNVGALFAELMQNPDLLEREMAYLIHSVNDDSPAGRHMIDNMVAHSALMIKDSGEKGTMRKVEDPEALAVALVMQSIAMLAYRKHVQRLLGSPSDSLVDPTLLARYGLPLLDVYTHGLYTDESYLNATRQALADQSAQKTKENHE
ncbi:TetR/AcrR family transcriptional regulator [Haematomicrobium sanguinis]|uniref:TetR/AcrR family transcriptional regulator n=1 Tax=Haematomicrobium sanguinis TaxID=479106 RepID=UPI00068C5736|nr:TetR family transcriptional regulator [Haematomicrobium sanguinis]